MNVKASLKPAGAETDPDYELVRRALEIITRHYRRQPSLDELAHALGVSATQLQKTFTRWSGLSPKGFLQAVTLDRARKLLQQEGLPLLDASHEVGLSGPGRLHDLFVTHEAVTPGIFKAKGEGADDPLWFPRLSLRNHACHGDRPGAGRHGLLRPR